MVQFEFHFMSEPELVGLDPGIAPMVEALRANRVETYASCDGGLGITPQPSNPASPYLTQPCHKCRGRGFESRPCYARGIPGHFFTIRSFPGAGSVSPTRHVQQPAPDRPVLWIDHGADVAEAETFEKPGRRVGRWQCVGPNDTYPS